jgi:glycosyltransferase involved in cell wall biosynthesis
LNRQFYEEQGVGDRAQFAMPYAVDNAFFQTHSHRASLRRNEFRRELGLLLGRPVILFAAKFTSGKAPHDLLAAWLALQAQWSDMQLPYLLFVGDGPLRSQLEVQAGAHAGKGVRFVGFRNQTELPAFYDLCDVFVLPSHFEPWGLVVNELMNAGKPIIVSDRVGAAPDLVANGVNGFIYPAGDVAALVLRLKHVLESPDKREEMGRKSLERINTWDFETDRKGLLGALDIVCFQSKNVAATS